MVTSELSAKSPPPTIALKCYIVVRYWGVGQCLINVTGEVGSGTQGCDFPTYRQRVSDFAGAMISFKEVLTMRPHLVDWRKVVRDCFFQSGFLLGVLRLCLFCDPHWFNVDDNFEDFASEGVVAFFIVAGYGRGAVQAHIGSFVGGKYHSLRVFDPTGGNLRAIDQDRYRAALSDATAIIVEIHPSGALPCCQHFPC